MADQGPPAGPSSSLSCWFNLGPGSSIPLVRPASATSCLFQLSVPLDLYPSRRWIPNSPGPLLVPSGISLVHLVHLVPGFPCHLSPSALPPGHSITECVHIQPNQSPHCRVWLSVLLLPAINPVTILPLSFLPRRAADPETTGPPFSKLIITFAPPSSQARRGASLASENFLPTSRNVIFQCSVCIRSTERLVAY